MHQSIDSYAMWGRVAELCLQQHRPLLAQRCYAAMKDIPKVEALHVREAVEEGDVEYDDIVIRK